MHYGSSHGRSMIDSVNTSVNHVFENVNVDNVVMSPVLEHENFPAVVLSVKYPEYSIALINQNYSITHSLGK